MSSDDAEPPTPPPTHGRRAWAWFAAAFALYIACQVPFLADPFGVDTTGINAASYHGVIQENYARQGFLRLRGAPMTAVVPADPPEGDPYVNHPPLYFWYARILTWLLGNREWSLRLAAVLGSAAACGLLTALARRWHGVWGAILTLGLFTTLPLSFEFGRMPNYEGPFLALTVATLALGGLPPTRARGGAIAALLFTATLLDWCGTFLVPALWVQRWILDGRRPPWRQVLTWAFASAVAVAAFLGLVILWFAGPAESLRYLRDLFAHTGLKPEIVQHGSWLEGLVRNLYEMLTPAGLVALTAAFAWHVKMPGRPAEARAFFFAALLVEALNVAVFPGRAYGHEYWWFYILPATTLGAAAPFAALEEALTRAGRVKPFVVKVVLAATVAAGCAVALQTTVRRYRAIDRSVLESGNALMGSFYDADTLMVYWSDARFAFGSFYIRPYLRPVKGGFDAVARYAERFRRGELRVGRLVVMVWLANQGGPDAPTPADLPRLEGLGFVEGRRQLGDSVRFYELTRF